MRISFCGKGGSGKTSVAALFIKYLLAQNQSVLAIDGDVNQHLGATLDLDESLIAALPKLGQKQAILQEYLRGTNTRIRKPGDMIESTPVGSGSRLIERDGDDVVTKTFILTEGTLRFMAIGGHDETDAGTTCYHKFTGAEGMFLNHYLDASDEYVVADMVAGADPFSSSGLATRFDVSVVVIEPTLKSVAVFEQAKAYADPNQVKIFPVANKIMTPADLQFIEDRIGQKCVCAFRSLDQLKNAEKGISWAVNDLETDTLAALQALQTALDSSPERNWEHYQAQGIIFHEKAAASWATATYGYDMTEQIDPDYKYPDVARVRARAA